MFIYYRGKVTTIQTCATFRQNVSSDDGIYIPGGCPKLKKRERLLLYYYSYTIVYDFTARITIVILNILKYSIDDFISVLR